MTLANSGLTDKEAKALRQTLRQLEEILTRGFLMGAGTAHKMTDLASRIRVRLNPPEPSALIAEANAMIDYGDLRRQDWVQAALKRAKEAA
jgi:hypothetical protein